MNKYYSFERNKSGLVIILLLSFLLLGCFLAYIIWVSMISMRTVLMNSVPEWLTYITIGSIFGLIFSGRATYYRPIGKTSNYVIERFWVGFSCGFILSLGIYDVFVFMSKGNVITYEAAYEITYPGPGKGRFGHCEAGLWFKDYNTKRWIQLCTNKKALQAAGEPGADAVRVSAHSNEIGSYIIDYSFIKSKS